MEPIEGRECYHCGDICGEIELNKCEQCGCEVCDNCVVKCTGCYDSICKVCGVYDREQLQWFCCDECRQEWYEEEEKKEMEIEEQKKRERELEWERWEREERERRERERIEYLIPEVLPMGKVVSLISQEGDGKSTLSGYLASVVSRGGHWPTGGTVPAGDVVIFSHEESPEHSIAPRLIANGGELGRIYLAESVIEADGQETEFDIERDIQTLDDWADELPDLRLVIFDPITSYVSCNENSNSEVRRALKPLIDFAERRNVCVLALSHLSKKVDLGMINRTLGSRAWSAVPRMVWALQVETAEDEDGHKVDTGRRFLLCVKCNLGRKPQGLRFAIEDSGAVVFDTERFSRNVDQDGGAEPSRASEIGRWLTDRIGVDVVPASEITKEGCERWGISKRRLGEIATKAGINKRFSVAEGCWVWTVKR